MYYGRVWVSIKDNVFQWRSKSLKCITNAFFMFYLILLITIKQKS
uniref:Uncharacterized protein n=1 Tax=Arundo donax TaxID=35708 RepID=A0A0A9A2I0_ARUDO